MSNIVSVLADILLGSWRLLGEMAPFLLLGFFCAGLLHIFIPTERIASGFSGSSIGTAARTALVGVPLPLCSCGIIPVASHFRAQGASRAATVSLLVSTPSTGIDSILATYALLGPLFAVVRPVAAGIAGILAGWLTATGRADDPVPEQSGIRPQSTHSDGKPAPTVSGRIVDALRYGFGDLVRDTGIWILIGVFAGAAIERIVPHSLFSFAADRRALAYLAALLIGVPMYVCATGSIPIAAGLLSVGFPPGAAFAFLFSGPATNTATISFVWGKLGRRALIPYLASIFAVSLAGGILIDALWTSGHMHQTMMHHAGMRATSPLARSLFAGVLASLILSSFWRIRNAACPTGERGIAFHVPEMTCQHCVRTIIRRLKAIPSVDSVRADLRTKRIFVTGTVIHTEVLDALRELGYTAQPLNSSTKP